MTYCADAFESLEDISFGNLKSENPKKMIQMLLNRTNEMEIKLQWKSDSRLEVDLEKNLKIFITRLINDAKAYQVFGSSVTAPRVSLPRSGCDGREGDGEWTLEE